jgi:cytochrome b subunit of formate dehydrogenase
MAALSDATVRHLRRFDRVDRFLHGFLMFSFLGLAISGMPLLFSHTRWAAALAASMGGYNVTGVLHRVFATVMIVVFATHVGRLLKRLIVGKDYAVLWGPTSMVPQPRDLSEIVQHFKWFVGAAERPKFERYTYWEKFDYWAVFWGMAIIGGSGLMLWFPEVFARVLPGWVFNVALLVHGEEALMAVAFIFTIHFFNGHLRPEKFPMDMVIFTGTVTETELRHERPGEYERLVRDGSLEAVASRPPSRRAWTIGRIVGTTAITIGLLMVGLIIFGLLSH